MEGGRRFLCHSVIPQHLSSRSSSPGLGIELLVARSNVFFFRSGPFTLTLLDVAAITCLRPHGIILSLAFTADGMDEFAPGLDLKTDMVYVKFSKIFAGHGTASVTKEE